MKVTIVQPDHSVQIHQVVQFVVGFISVTGGVHQNKGSVCIHHTVLFTAIFGFTSVVIVLFGS